MSAAPSDDRPSRGRSFHGRPLHARGLIIGKFMPPHRGHRYLIDFARAWVDRLTVLVCSLASEPIDGELRLRWMQESFPDPAVSILPHRAELPQEPSGPDDDAFWRLWRDSIRAHHPEPIDFVFASESYGFRLAAELDAAFVPVDPQRIQAPVSATAIRAAPLQCWSEILPAARPHFARRVAIVGSESAGKTTLAQGLAKEFGSTWAPEYGRTYLDALADPGCSDFAHIERIARGQIAAEAALLRQAERVLFCDTDLITTTLWSEILFGKTPPWVAAAADEARYDLTLVLDVAPWVADAQRHQPAEADRRKFHEALIAKLDAANRPHRLLCGDWERRAATAAACVREILV